MHSIPFLPNLLLLLSTAVIVVAIFRRLNLSPVLGYFVAGSVIGKDGLNYVTLQDTSMFAEFGVIFLLFAIGLELTFDRLKSMRIHVFGFGTAQVMITSVTIAAIVLMLGNNVNVAVVIAGALTLSSTAIVLQVIAESRTQSTQVGRLSLAVLLLQDFVVVPLLVLIPLLAGDHEASIVSAMGNALLRAIFALIAIFTLGRLLIRPLFGMISSTNAAKSNELFIATTLLIALGTSWATHYFQLSMALGAFVAGVLVAETEFQHQAEESITPFKGLFLGLFFMTVGMSIDIKMIIDKLPEIVAISLSLIFIKAIIISLLCLIFRFSIGSAIHAGLLLSQGGEFAFILFNLAVDQKIINPELGQTLMLVVTFTMALTPLLSTIGGWLANKIDSKAEKIESGIEKEVADLENHVIIAGFGRVGRMVGRLLEAEHVHYIGIDLNEENVIEANKDGFPVFKGDASHLSMLQSVGLERAMSVVLTISNDVTLKKTMRTIQQYNAEIPIIVRCEDLSRADEMPQLGGPTILVPAVYEVGLQLGGAVLKSVGVSEYEVSRIKNQFRAGNYIIAKSHYEEEDDKAKPKEEPYVSLSS